VGSNPAATDTEKEIIIKKIVINCATSSSTLVKQLTHNPSFQGSKTAATNLRMEKIAETSNFKGAAAAQW
jgi:hypothetical protein